MVQASRLIALVLASWGSLTAQVLVRPVPLDAEAVGIEGQGHAGRTEVLAYREHRIVLSRAVTSWEAAALPDGRWVILAGGVQPGLDVYLFDPRNGELVGLPFHVSEGLRLPSTFARGGGSWPRFDLPDLFVMAVERRGRISCLAVDASRQVPRELASVDLPIDLEDFEVRYDRATEQVRVDFVGADAVLEFLHPRAPRLVVEPRFVDFGDVPVGLAAERVVALFNRGRRPLRARLGVAGGEFAADPVGAFELEPGHRLDVTVRLEPQGEGARRGALDVESNVVGASVSIAVRARVVAAAPPEVETARAEPDERPDAARSSEVSAERVRPRPAAGVPRPGSDVLEALAIRRVDGGRVWVGGRVTRVQPFLVLRNETAGSEWRVDVAVDGSVVKCIDAGAGDDVSVAWEGPRGGRSDFVPIARVQPELVVEGGRCRVRTAPSRPFFLLAVELDEAGAPSRVRRVVRGIADASGRAVVELAEVVAPGDEGLGVVVGEAGREPGRLAYSRVVTP